MVLSTAKKPGHDKMIVISQRHFDEKVTGRDLMLAGAKATFLLKVSGYKVWRSYRNSESEYCIVLEKEREDDEARWYLESINFLPLILRLSGRCYHPSISFDKP